MTTLFHHLFCAFTLFFCSLTASQQLSSNLIYSQLGEQRQIELFEWFKTIRSGITVDNIDCVLSQGALQVGTSVTGQSNQYVLVHAQQQISSNQAVRIEVILSNGKYLFVWKQITQQSDGQLVVEIINTAELESPTGNITSISFSSLTSGYFSYFIVPTNTYYIGYFSLQGSVFTISASTIQTKVMGSQVYQINGQLSLFVDGTFFIGLVLISNQTTYTFQDSLQNSCSTTNKYVFAKEFPLLICGETSQQTLNQQYTISSFIANKNFKIIESNALSVTGVSYDVILNVSGMNGNVYITSYSLSINNIIYVTKITFNRLSMTLSAEIITLFTPQNINWGYPFNQIQFNTNAQGYLIVFSQEQIYCFSLKSSQLMFQLPSLQNQPEYEEWQLISFGGSYMIQFSNSDNDSITMQFVISIPTISFTQSGTNDQVYNINTGGQQLAITSRILPSNVLTISTNGSQMFQYQTLLQSQGIQIQITTAQIENVIIGSNLNIPTPTIPQNSNQAQKVQTVIKSIDLITNSQAILSIKAELLKNTYSTRHQAILFQYQNQQQYQLSIMNIQLTATNTILSQVCYSSDVGNILSVDINGFFTFESTSKNYQIALPIPLSVTNAACTLPIIETNCQKTDKNQNQNLFLFASDLENGIIFTICSTTATAYTFSINPFYYTSYPYTLSLNQPIQMVALQGALIIANNQKIIFYPYASSSGLDPQTTIILSTTLGSIQNVYLYSEAYILVTTVEQQTSFYLFSYQDNSAPLRSLSFYGYSPSSNVKQIYSIKESEEYLLIEALDQDSVACILVYRINKMIAQNQLYKSILLNNQVSFNYVFSSNGFLGYFDSSYSFFLYSLQYSTTLQLTVKVDQSTFFSSTPLQKIIGNLDPSATISVPFTFTFIKDISAQNAIIDKTEKNAAYLSSYFQQYSLLNTIQSVSLNLDNSVSSNVLQWDPSLQGLSYPIVPLVSNRMQRYSNTSFTQFDMIQGLRNFFIISTESNITMGVMGTMGTMNIMIGSNLLSNTLGNCYLYEDVTTRTFSSSSNSEQTKFIGYTMCTNYAQQITFVGQLQINLNWTQNYQTPSISCAGLQYVTVEQSPFSTKTIVTKIQSDTQFGLFYLYKNSISDLTQSLCLLSKQGFDCSSPSIIDSLSIIDVIYIQDLKINLFISSNGIVYTGFSNSFNLKEVYTFNLNQLPDLSAIVKQDQIIQVIGSIRPNSFLISYDKVTVIEIQASSSSQYPFDLSVIGIYYGEQQYQFSGYGTATSSTETLLLYNNSDMSAQYFFLFSAYTTTSATTLQTLNQIIKSSTKINANQYVQYNGCAKIFNSENTVFWLINTLPSYNSDQQQIQITNDITVSMYSSSTTSFNGVGMYLQLDQTILSDLNSISIDINIISNPDPDPAVVMSPILQASLILSFLLFLLI